MNGPALNLVVLRSADLTAAVAFYSRLGLSFTCHQHGGGPKHYAAEAAGTVFELYPYSSPGASTLGTRVGFRVPSVEAALSALGNVPGAIVSAPTPSEWGLRAVLTDPDGHRVELIEG